MLASGRHAAGLRPRRRVRGLEQAWRLRSADSHLIGPQLVGIGKALWILDGQSRELLRGRRKTPTAVAVTVRIRT